MEADDGDERLHMQCDTYKGEHSHLALRHMQRRRPMVWELLAHGPVQQFLLPVYKGSYARITQGLAPEECEAIELRTQPAHNDQYILVCY